MELLDGVDADALVKRFGPIPVERVVHLLRQMCHSLSEAESCGPRASRHQAGQRLPVPYGEDHDFVKVLRLRHCQGRARRAPMPPHSDHDGECDFRARRRSSRPNRPWETPTSTFRADIYSTGCVAYWLLTGELVFTETTPMKLLLAHAHTTPVPPSTKTELPIPF
jgi:serine/threonine-protein kinase